jgi:soluble lytic murein transglycosylase-like protein
VRAFRRKPFLLTIGAIALALLAAAGVYYYRFLSPQQHDEASAGKQTEAPPDLAKLRDAFQSGLEALARGDAADAVAHFGSFHFGPRAVEEYRLYYLANGHQLHGDMNAARAVLAALWSRGPRFFYRDDAGFNLGALYERQGDWNHAGDVYAAVAAHADSPAVAAAARWSGLEARFVRGDLASVLHDARDIAIRSPRAVQAADAFGVVRAIEGVAPRGTISLTAAERLERAVALMRDGDPRAALEELNALEHDAPQALRIAVTLNRGLALNKIGRYEKSNAVLEPLASSYYRYAIPAIYTAAKNYRTLANAIDPNVYKTVMQKKKVGTVKVRVGKGKKRRTVTKPKFANVKTTVKLVDLAKKSRKETYERLSVERLKDLLQLPLAEEVRLEVLNSLIAIAESKNQGEYEQQLVREVLKIDRWADPGLQRFWDTAWAAYQRGDLPAAKSMLRFIADTYGSPNVKRQAEYWYARTLERAGEKEEAAAIYRRLAASPYEDLYALHAEARGAARPPAGPSPLAGKRPDWGEIAEKTVPPELRLAYELTALFDMRDASLEVRKNLSRSNGQFAAALMADLYSSSGNVDLMYRSLRRAYPQLATVEQDSVPPYFLKMYYPIKYQETIRKFASKNSLDPFLVMALILQESYFNPRARSRVGATGLMQLMPATARELGRQLHGVFGMGSLEDPETNIELGTYHLKRMVDLFGNTQLAVASYNAGQGNVLKWRRAAPKKPMDEFLESIPFPETRNYVKRVTLLRSSYARMTR